MQVSLIDKYRETLEKDAELEKQRIDLGIELKILRLQMELTESTGPQNTENDNEFLSRKYRPTGEVAEFLGCSGTQVIRHHDRGDIEGEKVGPCWMWSTQSCVDFLNARAKT